MKYGPGSHSRLKYLKVINNPVDTLTTEYYEENNTETALKDNLEENIGQEAGNHSGSYCNPNERY